jgi:hypothetical protein
MTLSRSLPLFRLTEADEQAEGFKRGQDFGDLLLAGVAETLCHGWSSARFAGVERRIRAHEFQRFAPGYSRSHASRAERRTRVNGSRRFALGMTVSESTAFITVGMSGHAAPLRARGHRQECLCHTGVRRHHFDRWGSLAPLG